MLMKKYLFIATALVALASCSDDTFVGDNSPTNEGNYGTEIVFSSGTKAITRADKTGADAATLLGKNFVVEGVKYASTTQPVVFDHYNVNWVTNTAHTTTSNTNDWEYVGQDKHAHASIQAQTIKYWDYSATQYDFIAYSKGTATAVYTGTPSSTQVLYSAIDHSKMNGTDNNGDVQTDVTKITKGAYSIKGKANELAKCYIADLKTIYRDGTAANDAAGDYNKVVQFNFRSLSAKVRIALYETVPGYSINNVVFYTDASTAATDGKAHLYTTGSEVFNEEGEYIVYYPTTGSANKGETDYNKAHLKFVPVATTGTTTTKDFGERDDATNVIRETAETASGTDKLYIGRSSDKATYFGPTASDAHHYTVVIPNETGAVLNLKVNYTLLATDGSGEVINVTGATAKVPAKFASWMPGYAYTYIFKISENTSGLTNPNINVAGLYPITFDAIVTETEDGVQETITTVAEPSITTYSKGKVVTANDEYKTGANIYAIVENGTALTVGTNANLYTVTLEGGAAQTINEASVANVRANGTYDGTAKTYTVTDANGKKMVLTESTLLSKVTEIAAEDAPDGNAITINGAAFKPAKADNTVTPALASQAGTYVFEYIDTVNNKKYYKIIKVVD